MLLHGAFISLCWALPMLYLEIKHHENEQKPVKRADESSGWLWMLGYP